MRLFAAVLPPEPVSEELAGFVAELRKVPGADAVRWMERENWHFTLAFMAEVPAETVPGLCERLERAARRTEPFPLALGGGGQFGGRALWAGAGGAVAELKILAGRADAAARKSGLTVAEHRAYRPHLTLARSRGEADFRPYVEELAAFEGTPWTVAELVLVRSNLPTSGVPGERPRYEAVGRWPLGGAAKSADAAG
ncbi:RNA 2',3'-cyclic phosphodiesterase [Streptomyces flavofungini]|uniref:RNA 2',3'-cyclic phosphodiesterase n=1 Tax=Streptomyces flavofungini TaxID=68200 RepID=A0ABS0X0Y4_9ACTN|nr:RNA 2',3'-cyclic phosphodiesterase [Streptomyces flavofungini]MBJ3806847.1 RNA 2',3'-cyclic phosphodiesterase [Streptomyces flavofungini]GHC60144.1 RNA 2',3'-cyclic phosphodiesterase [Streptomyces flavofungini]